MKNLLKKSRSDTKKAKKAEKVEAEKGEDKVNLGIEGTLEEVRTNNRPIIRKEKMLPDMGAFLK